MYTKERLLEMLSSNKASVRYEACEWIRVSQESSPEIVNALEKATHDADTDIAERATLALQADVHHQMAITMGIIESDKTEENTDVQSEDTNARNIEPKFPSRGIVSFILSILVLLSCRYMYSEFDLFGAGNNEIVDFLLIGIPVGIALSSVLGISGLMKKDGTIYALLGVLISALIIVAFILVLYGVANPHFDS